MKYFLSKTVELSKEILVKLKSQFNLSEININEIKHWNDNNSPYGGVIIDTNVNSQYLCYPYDAAVENFKMEHPKGKVWKNKNTK